MTEYQYLTQEQIDCIKANYANQSCADDVQELFSELEEVTGLEIVTDLVSYEDGTADLLIFGENDKKEYFRFFCKAYNYLSPSIRGFGKDVETALEIIDSVLAWVESIKQEQINQQVLKANFLIDLLLNKASNYYLDDGLILLRGKELDQLPKTYNQMLTEVTNPEIQKIIYASYDQKYKYESELLNLVQ
ncbi:hypothetical protein NIES267_73630 (plasmid) [Calothrix parasitica NIES-267]|uniref:Uncharacterized protein n=1 Tax=Calothrix parasitica NIES-267 TaxID=1973488 RepID=A0A1Z4M2Y4_9CYAN|nr:hypothetical protein NIES267_73630 [Calothrix parasitica NIES-267]